MGNIWSFLGDNCRISLCRAGKGLHNLPTSAQSQGMVGSNLALSRDPLVARLILDWRDSFRIRLGGEWNVIDKLALRAGYLFFESSIGRYTFSPAMPLNDRHMFSVGETYHCNDSAGINVAYINSIFKNANGNRKIQPAFWTTTRAIGNPSRHIGGRRL